MTTDKKTSYAAIFRFALYYWRRRALAGIGLVAMLLAAMATEIFVPVYAGRIVDALVYIPSVPTAAAGRRPGRRTAPAAVATSVA